MNWLGEHKSDVLVKAVTRLGHYSTTAVLCAVALSVANDATGWSGSALAWAGSVAWFAAVTAVLADVSRHQERLCERCIAASPLDPQATVTRWRRALRLHHAGGVRAALLGSVITWKITSAPLFRHPSAWALAVDALTATALGTVYAVSWQHRRLYPWCPFCRWDGGGEHEVSPDMPAPAESR